jgi:hypothetical protein
MEIKGRALSAAADKYSQIAGLTLAMRIDVEAARKAGASWTEVGNALGISGQGARQRFHRKIPGRIDPITVPGQDGETDHS